jgi:hypothetical protein
MLWPDSISRLLGSEAETTPPGHEGVLLKYELGFKFFTHFWMNRPTPLKSNLHSARRLGK